MAEIKGDVEQPSLVVRHGAGSAEAIEGIDYPRHVAGRHECAQVSTEAVQRTVEAIVGRRPITTDGQPDYFSNSKGERLDPSQFVGDRVIDEATADYSPHLRLIVVQQAVHERRVVSNPSLGQIRRIA